MTTTASPLIRDLIKEPRADGKPYVSLEFFPPRTEEGVKNLHKRMERMKEIVQPLFTDMTWGAGGSTADLSLDLAIHAHRTGHVSNLHMTCTNIQPKDGEAAAAAAVDPKTAILQALRAAHDAGIRNIVALRGDPPAGETEWKAAEDGFTCALDLVKFMRAQPADMQFNIAVAGYPEGHPNAITEISDPSTLTPSELARSCQLDGKTFACLDADYKKEMDYLKQKIDAGADMIITQMFFDAAVYKQFVKDCRAWGIQCPIVPGLMCINAYAGFQKMTKFCKTRVPAQLRADIDAVYEQSKGKDKAVADAAMKEFGIRYGIQFCQDLIQDPAAEVRVLHFYTLNLEKVVYGILDGLKITVGALDKANELDAASQMAKGSAWARVGDPVTTPYGPGIVQELNATTGAARIVLSKWKLANNSQPIAYMQKGQYKKA